MARRADPRQARLELLQAYLRQCAARMLLSHYTIAVREGVADDDTILDVSIGDTMASATVGVSDTFWALSREEQREYCCHELIHVHVERLEHALSDSVKAHLTAPAYQAALDAHRRANEHCTDSLARAFAGHLELPPVFPRE